MLIWLFCWECVWYADSLSSTVSNIWDACIQPTHSTVEGRWSASIRSDYNRHMETINLSHCCPDSEWLYVWVVFRQLLYTYPGNLSAATMQFMMCANHMIYYGTEVTFACENIISSHYHHKQRVLTPGHQGGNDLHSLCRIGMVNYSLNNDDNNNNDNNNNDNNNDDNNDNSNNDNNNNDNNNNDDDNDDDNDNNKDDDNRNNNNNDNDYNHNNGANNDNNGNDNDKNSSDSMPVTYKDRRI